jgi:aldehyde reductase
LRVKRVSLRCGEEVPAFGMGAWRIGEDRRLRGEEIATLRLGLDLGVTLIDTAEMYGEGASEALIAEAIAGRRDEVFLVTKVYPHHAAPAAMAAACERSLRRLRTDRIDLYLLHWRSSVPIAQIVAGFLALRKAGKIRHFGVSNLDRADMEALWSVPGGREAQTDQLLYNLARRGIEFDLVPWLRRRRIPVMAYSPIEQARLVRNAKLAEFARRHGMAPAQAALAWLLAHDDVIVIPKTSRRERLQQNVGALDIRLTTAQREELDRLFPPPAGPQPLEIL